MILICSEMILMKRIEIEFACKCAALYEATPFLLAKVKSSI